MKRKELNDAVIENLWYGALEDYIRCAEFGHYCQDQEAHAKEMREHLNKLCLLVQSMMETEYSIGFEAGKKEIFKERGVQLL